MRKCKSKSVSYYREETPIHAVATMKSISGLEIRFIIDISIGIGLHFFREGARVKTMPVLRGGSAHS